MYSFTSSVGVWEIPFWNMPKLSIFLNKTYLQESILPEPIRVSFFFFFSESNRTREREIPSSLYTSCPRWGLLVLFSCSIVSWLFATSMPGFLILHHLPEFAQTYVHWVGELPSNHFIFCCPLLLSLIFPSIRFFFSVSTLCIRWPKYWRFSLSISPSNEYLVDFP